MNDHRPARYHRTGSQDIGPDARRTLYRPVETGYALITTLWVMAVLGVMAASLAFEAKCESKVEAWTMKSRRACNLARAGVHMTAGLIRKHARDKSHSLYDKWFSGPAEYKNMEFGRGYYSIIRDAAGPAQPATGRPPLSNDDDHVPRFGLVDEESMFNINMIDFHQLSSIPGMTQPLAANIIEYIVNKNKELEKINTERKRAGKPEIADKKGMLTLPVRRLGELLTVDGMTEEILYGKPGEPGGLDRYLTCFSSGKININTTSPDIMRAIGFDEQQIKVFTEYRRGKWDGFTSVRTALDLIGVRDEYLEHLLSVTSKNFRITCLAGFTPDTPEERIDARLTLGDEEMRFTLWETASISGQTQIGDSSLRAARN